MSVARLLIAAGLVFVLIGLLAGDGPGPAAFVVGLICLVAGGAWRILRGPTPPSDSRGGPAE